MAQRAPTSSVRRESPRSAVRIVQILQKLSEPIDEGWSLSVLSREMRAPKSSLLVLLRALTDMNLISQSAGFYRLDAESFSLASKLLSNRHFPEVARPVLQQVVDQTGETAVIGALSEDGKASVYIDKVESANALRFSAAIGYRRPLYASASGHVLLAFGTDEALERYLKSITIEPLTSNTIVGKKELKAAIAAVRAAGVAVTRDQATYGVTGFGAPIFGENGELLASLVLAAPSARIEGRIGELSDLARGAADKVSRIMGGPAAAGAGSAS